MVCTLLIFSFYVTRDSSSVEFLLNEGTKRMNYVSSVQRAGEQVDLHPYLSFKVK